MNSSSPQSKIKSARRPKSDHVSIQALMQEAYDGETSEDIIRRKCRDIVQSAKAHGWSGPPFCPEILASLNRIKVEETNAELNGEGCIFGRRGDVVIQYRSGIMKERQRFTICHEIAHTCFPDVFERLRNHTSSDNTDAAHRRFEKLCDIGAGELLMPLDNFIEDLGSEALSINHIETLRLRYVASIEATAKRALDLTMEPCAVAFLTDHDFEAFRSVPGRLRVKWCWKSKNFKSFIPSGTFAPQDSIFRSILTGSSSVSETVKERWWINNKPRSWYVGAIRLPTIPSNPSYPKAMILLRSHILK